MNRRIPLIGLITAGALTTAVITPALGAGDGSGGPGAAPGPKERNAHWVSTWTSMPQLN